MKKMMAMNGVMLAVLLVLAACEDPNSSSSSGGGSALYKVTPVSGGNGELIVSPSAALVKGVAAGTTITFRAKPDNGYRLKEGSVTVNNVPLAAEAGSFSINADTALGAEFETLNSRAIGSAAELAMIGSNDDYPLNGSYYLSGEITLSNDDWTPIGNTIKKFTGIFDGNGYAIKNLHLGNGATHNGLFGWTVYARIKNLTLELANNDLNPDNGDRQYIGAVAGYAYNTEFTNITVNAAVGGALALTRTVAGTLYTGGVAGYAENAMFSAITVNLDLNAETNGTVYAGGVAGYAKLYSLIADSTATGAVSTKTPAAVAGTSAYSGGIAGFLDGSSVNKSSVSGNISSFAGNGGAYVNRSAYSGGIAGSASSSAITDCEYTNSAGTVKVEKNSGADAYVGGIVGYAADSALSGLSACGTVAVLALGATGGGNYVSYAGGIAGRTYGESPILNCKAEQITVTAERDVSDTTANDLYAGGIVAYAASPVSKSHTSGTVTARRYGSGSSTASPYAGGIVAYITSDISECYSDCTVTALADTGTTGNHSVAAGGIAAGISGFSTGQSMTLCYSTGDVLAESKCVSTSSAGVYAAGIVASLGQFATIDNCSATGDITGRSSNTLTTVTDAVINSNGISVGGIFGAGGRAKVSFCYVSGTITAERAGVGRIYAGSIGGLVNNITGGGGASWVQNCAARSPVVIASGSNNTSANVYISRIATVVGYGAALTEAVASDCYFANNFALSNMTLTKNDSSLALEAANKALDKKDGLDKSAATLASRSTYETDLGWDFANTWNWDSASGAPVLRVSN